MHLKLAMSLKPPSGTQPHSATHGQTGHGAANTAQARPARASGKWHEGLCLPEYLAKLVLATSFLTKTTFTRNSNPDREWRGLTPRRSRPVSALVVPGMLKCRISNQTCFILVAHFYTVKTELKKNIFEKPPKHGTHSGESPSDLPGSPV